MSLGMMVTMNQRLDAETLTIVSEEFGFTVDFVTAELDEMIEEVAAFPNGEHDDLVDSMTQALMRYRQGNFVQLPTDDWEEHDGPTQVRAYY